MPYGLYLSAAGADVQSRRLEAISHNLANVGTPGFKRDFALLAARESEAVERGLDRAGSRSLNDVGGGVFVQETRTDFRPGPVRRTDNPADFALSDDGRSFFVVDKDGRRMLTRAGNFQLDAQGVLRTQQGYAVLGTNGQPLTFDPALPPPRLLPGGVLTQGEGAVAFALARPASLGDLVKAGENLFEPLAETAPVPVNERQVLSGHLEMSGVNQVEEMMSLIEASRAYEANVRLIQHQDQLIGALLGRVLSA